MKTPHRCSFTCAGDRPRDHCGVFGIFGNNLAAQHTYFGIYALQHRGQESVGIAASDGSRIALHKGMGLMASVFNKPGVMARLGGHAAIGHNRYSTTGATNQVNAQPILVELKRGELAAAHNGNLVNAAELRAAMQADGSIFLTSSDTEILLHLVARSKQATLADAVQEALSQCVGAYCFLFLSRDQLIAARDPYGWRPLCLGQLGDAPVVASESCALDIVGAKYVRSIDPGELLVIDESGVASRNLPPAPRKACCVFEYIYIARPDSWIFGEKADKVRRAFGRQVAQESPCQADIVIAVPDSANTAALGYAEASGIRFEIGLIRSHYVGRTFIAPHQHERDLNVKLKFNTVSGVLKGKRVVVVEDSIVRGTTMRNLVRLIRNGGAREVHVRVGSPQLKWPCFYGVDMSTREELIGASHSVEDVREFIGADSLAHLSVEGMLKVVPAPTEQCTACFTGDYPTEVPLAFDKAQFDTVRKGSH